MGNPKIQHIKNNWGAKEWEIKYNFQQQCPPKTLTPPPSPANFAPQKLDKGAVTEEWQQNRFVNLKLTHTDEF